jgi:hypothetical protein
MFRRQANCPGSNYVGSLNRLENSHAARRNETAWADRSATFPRPTRIQSRRGFRTALFIPDGNLRDNHRAYLNRCTHHLGEAYMDCSLELLPAQLWCRLSGIRC